MSLIFQVALKICHISLPLPLASIAIIHAIHIQNEKRTSYLHVLFCVGQAHDAIEIHLEWMSQV